MHRCKSKLFLQLLNLDKSAFGLAFVTFSGFSIIQESLRYNLHMWEAFSSANQPSYINKGTTNVDIECVINS